MNLSKVLLTLALSSASYAHAANASDLAKIFATPDYIAHRMCALMGSETLVEHVQRRFEAQRIENLTIDEKRILVEQFDVALNNSCDLVIAEARKKTDDINLGFEKNYSSPWAPDMDHLLGSEEAKKWVSDNHDFYRQTWTLIAINSLLRKVAPGSFDWPLNQPSVLHLEAIEDQALLKKYARSSLTLGVIAYRRMISLMLTDAEFMKIIPKRFDVKKLRTMDVELLNRGMQVMGNSTSRTSLYKTFYLIDYANQALLRTAISNYVNAADTHLEKVKVRDNETCFTASASDKYIELIQSGPNNAQPTIDSLTANVPMDNADELLKLGTAFTRVKAHSAAINLLTKSTKINPNNACAHGNLGLALYFMGKYVESIPVLQKAVALGSSRKADLWAWNAYLGYAYLRTQQYSSAVKPCLAMHANDPNDGRGHLCVAKAYLALKNYDKAIDYFVSVYQKATNRLTNTRETAFDGILASLAFQNKLDQAENYVILDQFQYANPSALERAAANAMERVDPSKPNSYWWQM